MDYIFFFLKNSKPANFSLQSQSQPFTTVVLYLFLGHAPFSPSTTVLSYLPLPPPYLRSVPAHASGSGASGGDARCVPSNEAWASRREPPGLSEAQGPPGLSEAPGPAAHGVPAGQEDKGLSGAPPRQPVLGVA